MVRSSRAGKLKERDRLLDQLPGGVTSGSWTLAAAADVVITHGLWGCLP
jgi:hypothetical protein